MGKRVIWIWLTSAILGGAAADSVAGNRSNAAATYKVRLVGTEEVPPVKTPARGTVTLKLHPNGVRLDTELKVRNLSDVVVAHLHLGPRGENGPAVAHLYAPADPAGRERGRISSRTLTRGDLGGPLEGQPLSALIEAMDAGNVYVNVHTVTYTAGEIRGQVVRTR